jgi:hypothetical protein
MKTKVTKNMPIGFVTHACPSTYLHVKTTERMFKFYIGELYQNLLTSRI